MPRPTPNSQHLTRMATLVQKMHKETIDSPTLLAAEPGRKFAVMGGMRERNLHIIEQETGDLIMELDVPEKSRSGMDFRQFDFDDADKHLIAYNRVNRTFAAWSLDQKKVLNTMRGEGRTLPSASFLPNGQIAVADGPRINTHRLGGSQDGYIVLSDELQAISFFPASSDPGLLVVVATFRRSQGGHSICCFHIKNNSVVSSGDGPFRPGNANPRIESQISVHEMLAIPGSTAKILVVLEEERLSLTPADGESVTADKFQTRLLALDPSRCKFYKDEIVMDGRFCLEQVGGELHLVDEQGRRRRVDGFPLRLEIIDWRLE